MRLAHLWRVRTLGRRLVLVMAVWAFPLAVLTAARLVAVPEFWPRWQRVLAAQASGAAAWIVMAPVLWWLVGVTRSLGGHRRIVTLATVVIAATALDATFTWLVVSRRGLGWFEWWAATGDRTGYLALAVVAARLASDRFRDLADQSRRRVEAERLHRRAELAHLDRQLQPHFLFNVMNAIAELVHRQGAGGRLAVANLASLVDRLMTPGSPWATLTDELASLEPYLALQRVRFGDRLGIRRDIDPAAGAIQVPTFVLQPLVENAIRHGIERSTEGGTVTITARLTETGLIVGVTDTGCGRGAGGGHGLGLDNVRRRLACCYHQGADCTLVTDPSLGTTATLTLPVRNEPEDLVTPAGAGGPAAHQSPDPAQVIQWRRPSWILTRMAAGWAVVGVVWVVWAAMVAWSTGRPLSTMVTPLALGRELALYLGLSVAAVAMAVVPLRLDWPPTRGLLAQIAVCVVAIAVTAMVIGESGGTRAERLQAWEPAQTRLTGFLMAVVVAQAWAWHLRAAAVAIEAAATDAARLALDAAGLRQRLKPEALRAALGDLAQSTDPDQADAIVVALADQLREALETSHSTTTLEVVHG